MFKQLNPEAQAFHPQTFPNKVHQKPVEPEHLSLPFPLLLPLSPHNYLYQKPLLPAPPVPQFFAAPPPRYLDKFGAGLFFPPLSRCNAQRQPQPHGVKSGHLPDFNSAATADDGAGNGAKKLMTTARGRWKSSHPMRRNEVGGGVWVPKQKKYSATTTTTVKIDGGEYCIRSPPCPTQEEDGTTVLLSGKTSVMIKNIPNQYRRHMLMEFLDALCLDQNFKSFDHLGGPRFEYDFLYLPMDFRRNNNVGYAFVNFTSAMAATVVHEILRDFKWGVFKDVHGGIVHPRKVCEITWAKSQGKEEMVNRFTKSYFPCRDVEYLPVVFLPPRDGANHANSLSVVGRCLPPQ